jgi:hypothetical protein
MIADDRMAPPGNGRIACLFFAACIQMAVSTSCTESVPNESLTQFSPTSSGGASNQSPGAERRDLPVVIIFERLELPVQTQDGLINGKAVAESQRGRALTLEQRLRDEIGLYPDALLKRIKLHRIVLCDDLSFNATPCFSFTDVERGSIYMKVQEGVSGERIRWTIHHELFHQLDYAGDGRLDPDPAWESLNPLGFRYAGNVEGLQTDPDAARMDTGVKGFVNRYATASPTEDKAELYALLAVEPEEARRRLADDEVLRRKATRIRRMVEAFGQGAVLLGGP